MTIASIKKQLAALRAIVKPANSLVARVERLNDEHRKIYDRYSERMDAFIAQCKADVTLDDDLDVRMYAADLQGKKLPTLRKDVAEALYDPMPTITATMTDTDAARIYQDYCYAVLR
ncbi:hypothetical protein UP10_15520 [Bradyrhizobium sp. LTSPM299]|uniref:hypothetical protein n=1 Tax=Bradyrhizobium sp. LTSPM299 TaxID=1619233 RepID=UPI0005C88594|nr:hypothetical protein [Bradyrhizobium sp. LTSPM299]KJC60075.1 hypothetical protein UP10_15520 [Bradyrhizobium sp. LTSPM299]